MKFNEQRIKGVFLIEPNMFQDERGAFRRHFCSEEFKNNAIVSNILQANVSENPYSKTLRGFHYQIGSDAEGKTLSCLRGEIYDIVVDLRSDSPTYLQWLSFTLNEENRFSVHIPPGCANAFLTMQDNSLIHYYCSASYAPLSERGVRFNDPSFGFVWPSQPLVISEKDMSHPDYVKEL